MYEKSNNTLSALISPSLYEGGVGIHTFELKFKLGSQLYISGRMTKLSTGKNIALHLEMPFEDIFAVNHINGSRLLSIHVR